MKVKLKAHLLWPFWGKLIFAMVSGSIYVLFATIRYLLTAIYCIVYTLSGWVLQKARKSYFFKWWPPKQIVGDEDCLLLNIYIPDIAIPDTMMNNIRLPVMVWIHGGGYTIGSGKHWITEAKMVFSFFWLVIWRHSAYSWNIKWQKCARMGLNSFHIKWMIGTHCNWKNQNPGSPLGATS